MSKKLGKKRPDQKFYLTVDAEVKPTVEIQQQWKYLNRCSQVAFRGAQYHSLDERDKTLLHEVINGVREDRHNNPSKLHINAAAKLLKAGLITQGKGVTNG